MYQEESIYNLVPKDRIEPPKEPLHRSKYPHWITPTASTFGLKTSSFPNVANVNGEVNLPRGAHPIKGAFCTLGKPNGTNKREPEKFHRKGEQCRTIPAPERVRATSEVKKPPVPTLCDKPIMGLKSDKNYITANAIDVILMASKKKKNEPVEYTNKRNYGKVPGYLTKLKNEIENEYHTIREMQLRTDEEESKKKKTLNEEEISALREGLQKRLEQLKGQYGGLSHKKEFDTLVVRRK